MPVAATQGPVVEGRLLSVSGGAAAGVRVEVWRCRDGSFGSGSLELGEDEPVVSPTARCPADVVATGRTGDDGRWSLRAPAAGRLGMRFVPGGAVPLDVPLELALGPVVGDLEAPAVRQIAGRAIQIAVPGGEGPVAGATVVVDRIDRPADTVSRRDTVGRGGAVTRRDAAARLAATTMRATATVRHDPTPARQVLLTDASGLARAVLAAGEHRITVHAAGLALAATTATIRDGDGDDAGDQLVLSLGGGDPTVLEVRDAAGRPVSGASVRVGAAEVPIGATDEQGRIAVAIDPREPLHYRVEAASGFAAGTLVAENSPPRSRAEPHPRTTLPEDADRLLTPDAGADPATSQLIVLEPWTVVTGRVVDRDTATPVSGALVWTVESASTARDPVAAVTDAAGLYSLKLAEPPRSEIVLELGARGYARAAATLPLGSGVESALPALALERTWTLEGTVTDRRGEAIEGAEVTVARESRRAPVRLSATSGSDGRFRIPGVAFGQSLALRATHPSFASLYREVPLRSPEHDPGTLTLVLEPAVTLTGRLVTPAGEPLGEAWALLYPSGDAALAPAMSAAYRAGLLEPGRAFTDRDGRFRIAGERAGHADLHVHARGWAERRLATIELAPPWVDLGDLVVEPAPLVSGRVVDEAGRGVAGAKVWFGPTERARQEGGFLFPDSSVVTTAPNGSFELAGLPDQSTQLRVERAGYLQVDQSLRRPPYPDPLIVELHRTLSVRGQVAWRSGAAVAGARVRAWMRRHEIASVEVLTDSSGAFRLDGLMAGEADVWASADGARPARLALTLAYHEASPEAVIELDPGAATSGRILEADGRPATGARISVWPHAPSNPSDPHRQEIAPIGARADGEGRFRIDGLDPGPSRLSAAHNGHLRLERDFVLRAGDNPVELVLEAGHAIRGRVVGEDGVPVGGAKVVALPSLVRGATRTVRSSVNEASDAEGRFEVAGLASGIYIVSADGHGYGSGVSEPILIEDRSVSGIEIVLPAGVTLDGRVEGLDPEELSELLVWARGGGPTPLGGSRTAWVGQDGTFRLAGLRPGTWDLRAHSPSAGEARVVIEIREDDPPEALLRFEREGSSLHGFVLEEGEPAANATVVLRQPTHEGNRTVGSLRTDGAGRFRFERIPPGELTLLVRARDGGEAALTIDPEGDAEIVVEIERAIVEIRVLDGEAGAPVIGATAALTDPARGLSSGLWTSDEHGVSRLVYRPGTFRLTLRHSDYLTSRIDGVTLHSGENPPVEVELERGGTIRFLVLDVDGVPLGDGRAKLVARAGDRRASAATDERGLVELRTLPPGELEVTVTAEGFAPLTFPLDAPTADVVPVRLSRGGSVRVVVPELQATAEPAILSARGVGSWPVVDGEGVARGLPPGEILLTVSVPGTERRYQAMARVVEGEEVTVTADPVLDPVREPPP